MSYSGRTNPLASWPSGIGTSLIPSSGFGRVFFAGAVIVGGVGVFFPSDFDGFFSAAKTTQLSKIKSEKAARALTNPARPLRNGSMNSFEHAKMLRQLL